MHIGTNNPRTKYLIGDHQLNCQNVQRDRVLVSANLKSRDQSLHAAKKATKVLAMLRNAFSSRTAAVSETALHNVREASPGVRVVPLR